MGRPQETAEVILIVIKRIIKWILITGVLVGIGIQVIFEISEWYGYQTEGKYKEKVIITAGTEGFDCPKDYPYQYHIINESEKTIEKVAFTIGITKKGFSNEINAYTPIDSYKILKPKEGFGNCFRTQGVDNNVDIKDKDVDIFIKYKDITFVK
ncbi:MAG: hypothetical protein NTU70_05590 [Methylococcales bacterium]|nr:hypothetical protein [Methylococcales bacterium]